MKKLFSILALVLVFFVGIQKSSALILTFKFNVIIQHYVNGELVSSEHIGACYNVGSETGFNAGTRDKDGGPQMFVADVVNHGVGYGYIALYGNFNNN
jgi:hypothetical protein